MICEKIDLYEYFGVKRKGNEEGYLLTYVRTPIKEVPERRRPAMLVCPGGGYQYRSNREAEIIALEYLQKGFSSFIVEYTCQTAYPTPLIEACMAVAYIRQNADKYEVDPTHIAAIGFSAGGHLACMLATLYNAKEVVEVLGDGSKLCRPDGVILSYPVVTMGEKTHEGTRNNITGGDAKLKNALSIENCVNENSVPAFIWHTATDQAVPVENSLMLAMAYKKAGVPFALHIFEKGVHGLSLCNRETNGSGLEESIASVGKWVELSIDWLKTFGFESYRV